MGHLKLLQQQQANTIINYVKGDDDDNDRKNTMYFIDTAS